MKISIILGTRPEIIKMSPIIRECKNSKINCFVLHTGQHYSYNLDNLFFEELELPKPKYNLDIGSGTHAEQTGKMMIGIEKILKKERPDIILVEGDTNTVLAGALAAYKLYIKVGHIEAGLRSYDRRMPEEINRILTDHCSDILFAPTEKAKQILINEGIEEKKISKDTKFLCTGKFKVGNSEYKCSKVHGLQNIVGGLLHSCNIFFYNLGMRLGAKKILYYAHLLGLGRRTGIDLPYEKKGFLPSEKWKKKTFNRSWYPGDTLNLSIGQGYLLSTPIQVAKLMNFFATRGYLIQPYIVEKIDKIRIPFKKKEKIESISRRSIEIINKGLREVVKNKDGTAHILEKLNLDIAGKTGTAQARAGFHGWFAGFFPYQNPKYIIVVFTEYSGSSFEACKVAYKFLNKLKENNLL